MKRFIVAGAIAVALELGGSGRAEAQIVYGFSAPNGSGMMSGGGTFMSGGFNNRTMMFSPSMFSPSSRSVMTEPTFGRSFGANRFNEFNRSNGMSFRNDFFQPNTFMQPNAFGNSFGGFGGNNFRMMGRGRLVASCRCINATG